MRYNEERKWQRKGVINWKLELFEYLRSSPFLLGFTQNYLYAHQDIVAILDSNQLLVSAITHGDSIDTPLAITTNGRSYYYHRDHLGSIIGLTDDLQNEVERYSYDPYGVTTIEQTEATNNPFAYTGRELDDDDLYYYRARYYDPTIQRFLSEDPIGLRSGDFNFYRFVQNDPVNYIDPYGLFEWVSPIEFWGGVGDFVESYWDMMDATYGTGGTHHGWAGQDAYFHCRANCEAAQRGEGGEVAAQCISDAREWADQAMGDPPAASAADQAANRFGRQQGASNPTGNCSQLCGGYRPGGSFPF